MMAQYTFSQVRVSFMIYIFLMFWLTSFIPYSYQSHLNCFRLEIYSCSCEQIFQLNEKHKHKDNKFLLILFQLFLNRYGVPELIFGYKFVKSLKILVDELNCLLNQIIAFVVFWICFLIFG